MVLSMFFSKVEKKCHPCHQVILICVYPPMCLYRLVNTFFVSQGWNSFLEGDIVLSLTFIFWWDICNFIALACLHVNLFGIRPHRLKDSFSYLVNHCFTSHYSSSWDVQIDSILHTLILVSIIVSLMSLCRLLCE